MSDPIATLAVWLAGHVEWMRHRPEADEFLSAVDACARVMRGLARGRSEQQYLGPCRVIYDDGSGPWECAGTVYSWRGAKVGRCSECGIEHDAAERERELNEIVRQAAFSAKDISDAHGINVKTIRTWADRGQLKTYWRTRAGLVTPWIDVADDAADQERKLVKAERGPRLHYVGDVLDLAAADKARLATEQAKRARRAAVKTAENEDAA